MNALPLAVCSEFPANSQRVKLVSVSPESAREKEQALALIFACMEILYIAATD